MRTAASSEPGLPGLILAFVAVLAAVAVALRALDWVPSQIGAEPRGIRRYSSVQALERKVGERVWLPAYFPDTLLWPAVRVRLVFGRPAAVGLAFAGRVQPNQDLIVCQTLGGYGTIPEALLPGGVVLQTTTITVDGHPAAISRVSLGDGLPVHDLDWESAGRSIRLRFHGPADQLIRMAESLERNRR